MRSVWKFPLDITDVQAIEVPLSAKPLTVQMQYSTQLTLWAEVELNDPPEGRMVVYVFGTGHAIESDRLEYVGTVLDPIGLVWHVYVDPTWKQAIDPGDNNT